MEALPLTRDQAWVRLPEPPVTAAVVEFDVTIEDVFDPLTLAGLADAASAA